LNIGFALAALIVASFGVAIARARVLPLQG
jgi:hypothetical protein